MNNAEAPPTRRLAERLDTLAARIPIGIAIAVFLAIVLRIVVELAYQPAVLNFFDSGIYVDMADGGMFSSPTRAVGYSVFLDLVHAFSANLERTIELQHLLGVATGILLYATVRRVGAPVWVALIGAAAVLFSLDQIVLEHTLASESPFTFVLAAALYAAVRGLEAGRPLAGPLGTRELWLLGAGLLLGVCVWMRAVAVPLIPFFALWVALAIPGPALERALRGTVAALPALALLLLYMVMNNAASGTFGLIQADGWGVYARTAQFADCSEFTPPEGTEMLCESVPPDERPAPDFYSYDPGSPAQREFGLLPAADDEVGDFGWAAIGAQPVSYVRTVGDDFLRYFFPDLNVGRPFIDAGQQLEIDHRRPDIEEGLRTGALPSYYDPVPATQIGSFTETLADLQQLLRVHPVLLLQAVFFAAIGLWFGDRRVRAAIALLAGSALVMLLAASTVVYAVRFAIPGAGPLLAAGALGLWVALERYRSGSPATSEATA